MSSKILSFLFFLLIPYLQPLFTAEPPLPLTQTEIPPKVEPSALDTLITKSSDPSYEHAFIKMILTLIGLLALVFFTLWALRKLSHGKVGSFGSQKKIKILEKRPLSPKTVLYLLELDGKQVFIAESQLEVKTLLQPVELDLD